MHRLLIGCFSLTIFQMCHVPQGGSVPPASNSRMPPLPHEPAGFYNDRGATVDIPLDSSKVHVFPLALLILYLPRCALSNELKMQLTTSDDGGTFICDATDFEIDFRFFFHSLSLISYAVHMHMLYCRI
jgi:hypothetical protein